MKTCKIVKFDIYPIATNTKTEVFRIYDLKDGFVRDDSKTYLLEYTSAKNAYIGAKHLGFNRVYGLTQKDKESFKIKSVKETVKVASMIFEG